MEPEGNPPPMAIRVAIIGALILSQPALAAIRPATLIAQVGDSGLLGADGLPVANLSYPAVNGLGALGFAGALSLGGGAIDGFVWFDGEIVWRNSEWAPDLIGAQTGGFSDAGGWLVRTAAAGAPQLWTHNGLLLSQGGWVAWGEEVMTVLQLGQRAMSNAGVPYWRVQLRDSLQHNYWLVLKSPTATGGDVVFDVAPDAVLGGYPIAGSQGVADFAVSGDERSKIYSATLSVDGATKSAIVVNGVILALQSGSTGGLPGELWYGTLGHDVAVNGAGAAAFSAQTSAAGNPWVIAVRGEGRKTARVVLREGDCVGTQGGTTPCLTLAPHTEARSVALSEGGQLVHLWIESFEQGGDEYLFHSCAPANARASTLLLSRGDSLDLDGDGLGDAVADRVGLPGEQQVAFGNGKLYVGAELDYGPSTVEALLELELPACLPSRL